MAAEILTPTCETTGLPLPILPTEPRHPRGFFMNDDYKFNNHHLYHPKLDPQLADSRGKALRGSRLMRTRVSTHKFYHQTFIGPELPTSDDDVFRAIVFNVAGVMPKEGIELFGANDWIQRPIEPKEYEIMAQPQTIKIERAKNIARFISEHTLNVRENDLVSTLEVEEFVDSKTPQSRKKELASNILGESLDLMLIDLNPTHKQFRDDGLVFNRRSKTLRHAAKTLVRRHAFGYFRENLFDRMAYQ